jgi:Protein of unknown function DUF262/Protein of unknown function (DUF1524)
MGAIEFGKDTLGNILQARQNLKVPINQRSYAWEEDHVRALCTDLNGAITGQADEYFLGTIIVLVTKDKSFVEVHDGQQRLATSMMLIAGIRDYFFYTGDEATANAIAARSLRSVDIKTLGVRPHLQLSNDDNQFFVDYVLRNPNDPDRMSAAPNPTKESHELIKNGSRTIANYITDITKPLPEPDRVKLLHRWLEFLESGARVIWVEVGDQPTAYRVFETMNDRGLRISEADLLKNYLCSLADPRREEIVHKWQTMTAILESLGREDSDIVDYLRYEWITSNGHTRRPNLFDEIKNEVKSEPTALKFADRLEVRSNDYAAIMSSSSSAWNAYHLETRAMIGTIHYLGISQVRPILMAAFRHFGKTELEKLIALAVNWSVRCLLSGVSSGTLEGHYGKNAKKITDGVITDTTTLAKEMAIIIPSDSRFRDSVATAVVSTGSLSRYYLRRLQMEQDGNVDKQYVPGEGKEVTLEHILPIKPGPEWAHISEVEARANYNRLGNQALLSISVNSGLQNAGFSKKKQALMDSEFSLTKIAGAQTEWGIKEISERQKILAALAVKAWPY